MQGVSVTLAPSGVSRTTGSDGYFEFLDLEPQQYEIQAQKDGYISNNKSVSVVVGYTASGDIQLAPIVKEGKLELSVNSMSFGSQRSTLSFDIRNNGNKSFNWNISGWEKLGWLNITPYAGTLDAGKSCAVTVTLNRELITEYKEAIVIVKTDNESMALEITAEAFNPNAKISLSSNTLNFGTEYNSLTFDVQNIGNAGDVDWNITAIDVDWIKVTPVAGTTAMGKSSVVKVDIDRSKLEKGDHKTTIIVNADGESSRVTINVKNILARYVELYPSSINIGTEDSYSFTMRSYNGATSYELYGRGDDFSWAYFSKVEGVIPEYNPDNSSTVENIVVNVDRTGLAAGNYSFVLIVHTDLGDYELPVTMTVEKAQSSDAYLENAVVITNNDNLEYTLTSCTVSGTTATIEYMVENIGNNSIDLVLWGSTGGYSYIYDDCGNEYTFGYNQATLTLGAESNYSGVSAKIPSGVKIKGSIKIYNVADDASMFSCIALGPTNAMLTFKNVAIKGRKSSSPSEPQTTGTIIPCSDDFEFVLLDCKRNAANKVTISYKVKNVARQPKTLSLWGSTGGYSYIYDNCGNEYTFGYNQATLTLGAESSTSGVSATIPSEVYVNGSVVINNVDTSATEITNITLGGQNGTLIFKNVKIR